MNANPKSIDLKPGEQVTSGNSVYLVENELGEGGFGSVYKVRDQSTSYALKLTKLYTFLPNERVEYAKRFKQEYEYSSKLNSEFVVRSHDYDLMEGNPFMVMDLCSNGNLRDYISKKLTGQELDNIAYGILKGLEDLHREGIIHRDIKPENILFDERHRPKLADFGISASVKKRHTVSNFMGHAKAVFATGTYSPPEQIDPKRAIKVMGPTNDIYAFGAMMYEIITHGSLPFGSFEEFMDDMEAYEKRKKNEDWNRAELKKHATDEKWLYIINKCIRFDPARRYQQVGEIIVDLGFQPSQNYQEKHAVTPSSGWHLKVQNGEEIGRIYHLTNLQKFKRNNLLTMGWFNEDNPFSNDIGVSEHFTQYVSSYHATLRFDPGANRWTIIDGQFREKNGLKDWYKSTNGVLVNGKWVKSRGVALNPGDIITIGDTTLKVLIDNML
ncbi:MAG: protein kinase [Bacteroidales bacterium]|nr:protein kinase [Bacteroidales bacterium]MCF8333705.1 protein kinase [Bacteroidales bacterium]